MLSKPDRSCTVLIGVRTEAFDTAVRPAQQMYSYVPYSFFHRSSCRNPASSVPYAFSDKNGTFVSFCLVADLPNFGTVRYLAPFSYSNLYDFTVLVLYYIQTIFSVRTIFSRTVYLHLLFDRIVPYRSTRTGVSTAQGNPEIRVLYLVIATSIYTVLHISFDIM